MRYDKLQYRIVLGWISVDTYGCITIIFKNIKILRDHNPVEAGWAAFFLESNTDSDTPAAFNAFLI